MTEKLVEGRDYTIENGKFIFTAYYLSKRGYCCFSERQTNSSNQNVKKCKNCPYKGKNEKLR